MAWDEAQYTIDEVIDGVKTKQISGIPPKDITNFLISAGNKQIKIKCTPPEDTIVDGKLICTVAGVKIVRKEGSAPISLEDGILIADVLRGQTFEAIDGNLTNGVTYYYGFFPYSDHGVYNYNPGNIQKVTPKAKLIWAFDQNFADLNPETTITYPAGYANSNFAKMHTNEGTGEVTAGDWLDFLQKTLKNFPFMVRKDGTADYPLNPDDYTKKKDDTASDYNNTGYNGGAFAWLNKIYMRETYSSDGESRRVEFANYKADGFYPVGFIDPDENEMEGVWIPMGYMDASGRTLIAETIPVRNKQIDQDWILIQEFNPRGVFFGGPIIHVLRDLEYMIFKSTNIQESAGYGCCNLGYADADAKNNQIVPNGTISGWKGTSDMKTMNKYFHSQVLGNYHDTIKDPYTILINKRIKMSDHYIYDLSGNKLIDTGYSFHTNYFNQIMPCHLVKLGDTLGSAMKSENTGSSSTGLCDGLMYSTKEDSIYIGVRIGDRGDKFYCGPGQLKLVYNSSNFSSIYNSAAVLLLPPPGYAPDI